MRLLHVFLGISLLWVGQTGAAQSAVENDDIAIIIGNRTYSDRDIPKVSFAHNDARAMRLFAVNVLNIRQENILYLEDATQAQMQSAFGREGNHRGKAFQYVKPGVSNLYVFYSGHGLPGLNEPKNYLLPVDAEIETAEINGYPLDVLYENLAKIEARSVTVFIDACFSGSSHAGTLIPKASGAQILPNTATDETDNLTVITAASSDQLASWDEESKHGLFTDHLLKALYGEADHNQDGQIKVAEVSDYLNQEMRYKARRTFNREQIPTVMGDQGRVLVTANLQTGFPERPKAVPSDLYVPFVDRELEPVEQQMYALKNTNVRRAPSVKSEKLGVLPEGSVVNVIAKLTEEPWYAIERDQEFIGYVYQPLLGGKPERDDLRALEERLARLEARTIMADRPEILPDPPQTADTKATETITDEPQFDAPLPQTTAGLTHQQRGARIEGNLKEMGALLARQNFVETSASGAARTSLKYNWVRLDVPTCRLTASVSFQHDKTTRPQGPRDRISIFDRAIEADFRHRFDPGLRTLRTRDVSTGEIIESRLYRYGPFRFKHPEDLRVFKNRAEELEKICQPLQASKAPPPSRPADIIGAQRPAPPQRDW